MITKNYMKNTFHINWKRFIRRYNGWIAFLVGLLLYFLVPKFYHLFDPTAGQYDAGYLHPIVLTMVVVSFGAGFAFSMVLLTAPALFKAWDMYMEGNNRVPGAQVKWAFGLYAFFFAAFILVYSAIV
jgi:hypothetical protein